MSDPFGRGDRTVFIPNPAGRRPSQATPQPPSQQPAFAPAGFQQPSAAPPPPPSYYAPPPQAAPPPAAGMDDWAIPEPPRAPPPMSPDERRRALVLKRDVVVAPNANPFLRAAGPLLLLLGRLRVQLSRASFANLMEQVAAAIEDFEKDTRGAGVTPEQTRAAKYVVCATADDIVQNIPTDDRHVWTQYSMLARFFGERIGGVRFFEELERAKLDPSGNYNLLELMHACLALGFQGMHRTSGSGPAALQQIQRNLYEVLRRTRETSREVSPRWLGQDIAAHVARFRVPLWSIGAVTAVLLLGFYVLLRMLLAGSSDATATALLTVHPQGDVAIQRRIYKPPPPPPPPLPQSQAGRLKQALASEAASGQIVVEESGSQVVIRIAAALFAPGDAAVKPEFQALLKRLATLLNGEAGPIKVIGHTDSQPIRNVRFPSNFELSKERANAVGQIVKANLAKADRVEIDGKGADAPIAPNTTPEGRARNRRVELVIPRNG